MCAFSYAAQEPAALTFATYCFLACLLFSRRQLAAGYITRIGHAPPGRLVVGVAPQVLYLDGEHLAPGALGVKERKVFESPPEPRARMAVIRDSLSPVDATSAFASAAAARASRRSGGRREPNTPLSRGMSEPERGV